MTTANKSTDLTLADWAKRIDPDGKVAMIIELLSNTNEILTDAVFREGNLPTGERTVIRTGLPVVYWRALNQGVPKSKSTTSTVDETCGMLEAYSEIDVDLAMLNGNTAEFRLSEDRPFLEAMNQTQAVTMIYGNPATDPRQYLGLAGRYSSLSAGNAQNILDAGGTGTDNTSVWLVVWSDQTVFCTFPKGSQQGLMHKDLGEQTIMTAVGDNATQYQGYRTHYQWKNGLVVKDWRYVVRIANIDVSDLKGQTGTQAATAITALINQMAIATALPPMLSNGKAAFYMNRTVHAFLMIAALNKSNAALNIQQGLTQFGDSTAWTTFLGIPLRKVDAILNTESRVV